MNNIKYNKEYLSKYDNCFYEYMFFSYELDELSDYTQLKNNRKVIECSFLDKYIYLSTLNCYKIDNGYIINSSNESLYLVNVGENIYFLASCDSKELNLYSMLFTFMTNTNCYIDISKYSHLFNKYNNISLYKKKKS